jgi:hypothetical protein
MDANYSVKRNPLSGAASVNFKCPACAAAVKFDLDDAGTRQPCPACGVALAVPGTREKESHEAAMKAKQEDQKRAKAERERAAKEIAEAEAERERFQRDVEAKRREEEGRSKPLGAGLGTSGAVMARSGLVAIALAIVIYVLASASGEASSALPFVAGLEKLGGWLLAIGSAWMGFGIVSAEIFRWGRRFDQRLSALEAAKHTDEPEDGT